MSATFIISPHNEAKATKLESFLVLGTALFSSVMCSSKKKERKKSAGTEGDSWFADEASMDCIIETTLVSADMSETAVASARSGHFKT